jgi:hypothetical protein
MPSEAFLTREERLFLRVVQVIPPARRPLWMDFLALGSLVGFGWLVLTLAAVVFGGGL